MHKNLTKHNAKHSESIEVTLEETVAPKDINTVAKGFWSLEEPAEHQSFSCDQWKDELNSQDDLNRHIENSHTNIEYMCTVCPFKTDIKEKLEEHILNLPKICNVCNEKFHSDSDVKVHTANRHKVCTLCTLVVLNEDQLEKHTSEYHRADLQEGIVNCDLCDAQLESINSLNKHKTEVHGPNKILVEKSYIDNIIAENEKVKAELLNLKDDFKRLNNIFENSRNTFQDQDRNNDVELN